MKDLLQQLMRGEGLSAKQAERAFGRIMRGEADPRQVAALLSLLAAREPTVEELIGVAQVMRQHVVRIAAPTDVIDTCGTGGVGSRVFNVSTAAALVAAGAGAKVAEHGNRAVTSRSGSSDVLRALGVNIEAPAPVQARCLAEAGICFAFAPQHHPAMRHVAEIRQALGFATIFNLVGPLTNPAGATRQLVGVRSASLADKVLAVLVELGAVRAMVVCGSVDSDLAGKGTGGAGRALCELSVSGGTYVVSFDGQQAAKFELLPEAVGLQRYPLADLEIKTPAESAEVIRSVLAGKKGAARDMVLLNAAGALWVAGMAEDLTAGVKRAAESIDSGAARQALERLVAVSGGGK